jgi:two-component system chemotaxis sensor kinase CheA
MNDDRFELRAELLEDFFAECDEQLSNVRTQLGTLEEAREDGPPMTAALASVYRSIHSFKGNAAIVGLTPAEHLAHAAETLLRRLTRREAPVTEDTLDLLGSVGDRLEQMIAAFRARHPLPEAGDLLERLGHESTQEVAAAEPLPPRNGEPDLASADPVEDARARGFETWRASFAPSPALDARGVNVNSIRTRLGALGEIISATPQIKDGGKVIFDFALALRGIPTDLAAWEADGVTFSAATAPPAAGERTSAPAEAVRAAAAPAGAGHIVRVDLSRLDELMRITGELIIHRSRLQDRIAQDAGTGGGLQEVNVAFMRSLRELRDAIVRVRLVPVLEIFSRLPFVVRDLSRDHGKKIRLVLEGQDTEIDKYIVERLREPLLHLVRNAVSHGVETPEERVAAGKPPEATLLLRASTAGDLVQIQIRDDGRGIDAEKVAVRARASGLDVPGTPGEPELLRLICTPGFSTRDTADRAAGRGVGMAVVDTTLRELGGSLVLSTVAGQFTQFTARLPLTLSIADVLLVSAADHVCAVPQGNVEEIVLLPATEIRLINQAEVGPYRGGLLPLVRLGSLFGDRPAETAELTVLVIQTERGACGLTVDRVQGQREVVIRPMNDPMLRVPGMAGATELGDGRPVLVLDTTTLQQAVLPRRAAPRTAIPLSAS